MNLPIKHMCIAIFIAIAFTISQASAAEPILRFHCPDRMRDLMMNSCSYLSKALQEKQMIKLPPGLVRQSRIEREIRNETNIVGEDYYVEFLENETIDDLPRGHRLYNVRHHSYPSGLQIALSHRNAKLLRHSESKFKIEPVPRVYQNNGGRLEKSYRNKRETDDVSDSKLLSKGRREVIDKMATCCLDHTHCIVALCLFKGY